MSIIKCLAYVIVLCSGLLLSCAYNTSPNTSPDKKRPQGSTVVFALFSGDTSTNYKHFNRWNHLEKTKGSVDIFFDPANQQITNKIEGITHAVTMDKLEDEFLTTLSLSHPKRLIVFIDTHGASSGNFCYKNKSTCHLTEDFLINSLQNYAKVSQGQLEHVLIAPSSCYNKRIMDRFVQRVKTLSWPFRVSVLNQIADDVCVSNSPAYTLLNNIMYKYEISVASLERFLNLATLDEFLSFDNDTGIKNHLFEHRCFNDCKEPIKLADFGFDLELYGSTWPHLIAPLPFPSGKQVHEVLTPLIDRKFQKYVKRLQFVFPMLPHEKWDDNKSQKWIDVYGDLSVTIPLDSVNHMYRDLNALFSQNPARP